MRVFGVLNSWGSQAIMEFMGSTPEKSIPQKYLVVTCPRCGKFVVARRNQLQKQCPVCRQRFPLAINYPEVSFASPADATRFIVSQEARKIIRMDFVPIQQFNPALLRSEILPRTGKTRGYIKGNYPQFKHWVLGYFTQIGNLMTSEVPLIQINAAAVQAGFFSPKSLVDRAVIEGWLTRPHPYSVALAMRESG